MIQYLGLQASIVNLRRPSKTTNNHFRVNPAGKPHTHTHTHTNPYVLEFGHKNKHGEYVKITMGPSDIFNGRPSGISVNNFNRVRRVVRVRVRLARPPSAAMLFT